MIISFFRRKKASDPSVGFVKNVRGILPVRKSAPQRDGDAGSSGERAGPAWGMRSADDFADAVLGFRSGFSGRKTEGALDGTGDGVSRSSAADGGSSCIAFTSVFGTRSCRPCALFSPLFSEGNRNSEHNRSAP